MNVDFSRMRRLGSLRALFPGAGLALAGHAVAYGTLWPDDGIHGYFSWYQPLYGSATAIAIAGIAGLFVLSMLGNERAIRTLAALLPRTGHGVGRSAHRLAVTALGVLLVQETIESSLASGRFVLGAFSGPSLLLLLAFLWLVSLALVYAGRELAALVGSSSACRRSVRVPSLSAPALLKLVGPRALAAGWALRAPPLLPA
jgi:hypothetical protein